MNRRRLSQTIFEHWLDSPLHGWRERGWWFIYRLVRGWSSLYALSRHTSAINELRPPMEGERR
jgi:hypothetical protein